MRSLILIFTIIATACATTPPPRSLTELQDLASSPRGGEAKQLAPQAYHHALQLAKEARLAHEQGNEPLAEAITEQAQAELEQAFALTRTAKAELRRKNALAKVSKSNADVAAIDAQQTQLTAQTEALELRARVIRDALPLSASGKATPEREKARKEAARALLTDARLLCVAAQLLQPGNDAAQKQLEVLGTLERETEQGTRTVPIDGATKARSACLTLLSAARQANGSPSGADGKPVDALLDELARGGYQPQRDDRGVIVTLRNAFDGNRLAADGSKRLEELARVALNHRQYPVMLVLHQATRGSVATASDNERLAAAQRVLQTAGVTSARTQWVGNAQPLVPASHPRAASENARLELVFVAPSW